MIKFKLWFFLPFNEHFNVSLKMGPICFGHLVTFHLAQLFTNSHMFLSNGEDVMQSRAAKHKTVRLSLDKIQYRFIYSYCSVAITNLDIPWYPYIHTTGLLQKLVKSTNQTSICTEKNSVMVSGKHQTKYVYYTPFFTGMQPLPKVLC